MNTEELTKPQTITNLKKALCEAQGVGDFWVVYKPNKYFDIEELKMCSNAIGRVNKSSWGMFAKGTLLMVGFDYRLGDDVFTTRWFRFRPITNPITCGEDQVMMETNEIYGEYDFASLFAEM